MSTQVRAPAHFSVNLAQLKLIGVENPLSPGAVELYDVHGLSTQDRLFFCLWHNTNLRTRVFGPGDRISVRGDRVHFAQVVLSGRMEASDEQNNFTFGAGSVIGLAEGMATLPHSFTVTAMSTVTTRFIRIDDAQDALVGINAGLRGICRTAIARTLGLKEIPENLK